MMQPWFTAEGFTPAGEAEAPLVWPSATDTMKIDVAVNKDSKIWVLHNQPFPDYLEWIEFDAETRLLTFITAGGRLQDLGVPIHPPMDEAVARARDVHVIYMRDKKIRDIGIVPLTVRQNAGSFRGGKKS